VFFTLCGVPYSEMHRLKGMTNRNNAEETRMAQMEKIYAYQGEQTCAADGMCQEKCPVKINTGTTGCTVAWGTRSMLWFDPVWSSLYLIVVGC
jgi:succinate dehydrogenase/fumarate reductase-like Fe-S protein